MVRAPMARNVPQSNAFIGPYGRYHRVETDSERTSLTRCRELLGDEAAELSDEQLDVIGQHAHAMANVLVELFLSADSRS